MANSPQSPFYTIKVTETGEDIGVLVTDFSFEDEIEKDDLIKLTIRDGDVSIVDNPSFNQGNEIVYQYGYKSGKVSPKRVARISGMVPTYAEVINIVVTATDRGLLLKKKGSNKIWKKITISQILNKLARFHGLIPKIETTEKVYESIPQSNRTDFEFIKYLTTRAEGGSFIFYIKDNKLIFKKRRLEEKSIRTFEYKNGSGPVLSFKPSINESTQKPAASDVNIGFLSAFGLDESNEKVDDASAVEDTKLGDESIRYNADAERIPAEATTTEVKATQSGKPLVIPAEDKGEAISMGNKVKKDASLKEMKADLSILGDPHIFVDKIITMQGVGRRFGGNWYSIKVVHKINSSGYRTSINLNKNASNFSGKKEAVDFTDGTDAKVDVNNDIGNKQGDKLTKEVDLKFNQNSKRVN